MTYNTIPIPQFSFTDVPESEAEKIANTYFKYTYSMGYNIEAAKDDIRHKVQIQHSNDRIVILSYLINKLTERIVSLPVPQSDTERSIRQRDTIPTYKALLHFLYMLIKDENIKIPNDLFDEESYQTSQKLLLAIHESLEQLKTDNPDKAEAVTTVQNEIKKSSKFWGLGKEDWMKMLIGQLVAAFIKEGIVPFLPSILSLIQSFFVKLLNG